MALNVANWTDKQLDELDDMLRSADFSSVASFIWDNFLATGSRIITDTPATKMVVTVNGVDPRMANLSAGVFLHNHLVGQIDSTQTCAILGGTANWGTGEQAGDFSGHAGLNRYSIISIKQAEQLHTQESRWFVDDTVEPNTYSEQDTYTLINKCYYDIQVSHGDYGASPTVPDAPVGYWTICEIYIPHDAVTLNSAGVVIYDTTDTSQKAVANWDVNTRIKLVQDYQEFDGSGNTKMFFFQASAPTNWTQVTTASLNGRGLRVTVGTGGGVGGSRDMNTGLFTSEGHVLTIAEMPAHHHTYDWYQYTTSGGYSEWDDNFYITTKESADTGGDQPHTHGVNLNLKYMDVIICSKD